MKRGRNCDMHRHDFTTTPTQAAGCKACSDGIDDGCKSSRVSKGVTWRQGKGSRVQGVQKGSSLPQGSSAGLVAGPLLL